MHEEPTTNSMPDDELGTLGLLMQSVRTKVYEIDTVPDPEPLQATDSGWLSQAAGLAVDVNDSSWL